MLESNQERIKHAEKKENSREDDQNYPDLDAMTQEDMESQAIAASMRLAYQQILDGTASQQVIVHFLRAGSQKQKEELEKLRDEKALCKLRLRI